MKRKKMVKLVYNYCNYFSTPLMGSFSIHANTKWKPSRKYCYLEQIVIFSKTLGRWIDTNTMLLKVFKKKNNNL